MKINLIGGGPAALYFALLMKKQNAAHEVTVIERDGPHDTFGWGIVFSETTLDNFAQHDAETYAEFIRAGQMRELCARRIKGQRDKALKAARSILLVAEPQDVIHALLVRLHMAVQHRAMRRDP